MEMINENRICRLILTERRKKMTNKEQEVTWDLTELFSSINDPSVEKAINEAKVFADDFREDIPRKNSLS